MGEVIVFKRPVSSDDTEQVATHCSFCKLDKKKCQSLITGPNGVGICKSCVDICTDLIGDTGANIS